MDDRLNTGGGVRHLQENPHLGEFRVHAAFAQLGIHLSPRTRGRILAVNRRLYVLEKSRGFAQGEAGDVLPGRETLPVLDGGRALPGRS